MLGVHLTLRAEESINNERPTEFKEINKKHIIIFFSLLDSVFFQGNFAVVPLNGETSARFAERQV
jgi:hypothetical protein